LVYIDYTVPEAQTAERSANLQHCEYVDGSTWLSPSIHAPADSVKYVCRPITSQQTV